MPGSSALAQSYNLMKMSSEVTKTQAAPSFINQDRSNNYYKTSPQQIQSDYTMNTYGSQRIPSIGGMQADQNDNNHLLSKLAPKFLDNFSPADMGIPMDAVTTQRLSNRVTQKEKRLESPNRYQSDFPAFEDTFKSKQQNNLPGAQPQAEIPFDEQPVGGGSTQPQMQTQDFSAPSEVKDSKDIVNSEPVVQNDFKPLQDPIPNNPNFLNVDEIKIGTGAKTPLTFEELLEKELNDKENNTDANPKESQEAVKKPKKEFLRRTLKKTTVPKEKKGGK
jgi:hypothetical protein